MATSLFTTGNNDAVDTVLKCFQEIVNLQPAGTWRPNNSDI
jgi:hypothetical protein